MGMDCCGPRNPRILFLDIDGVLNSGPYFREWYNIAREPEDTQPARFAFDASKIDPLAVERVNRIVEATGAKVVICSSWRHYHPLSRLRQILRARGFAGSVIGVTPAICDAQRGAECAAWLATHRRAAWSFAALDDDCDYQPMMGRLVKTGRKGLLDRHVRAAIKLLQTPAPKPIAAWRARSDKLMARAVTLTPNPRMLSPMAARARVLSMYKAHGYSNVVIRFKR